MHHGPPAPDVGVEATAATAAVVLATVLTARICEPSKRRRRRRRGRRRGGRGRRREVDFLLLSTGGTMSLRERGEGGIGCAEAVKGDRAKEETSLRER